MRQGDYRVIADRGRSVTNVTWQGPVISGCKPNKINDIAKVVRCRIPDTVTDPVENNGHRRWGEGSNAASLRTVYLRLRRDRHHA